MNGYLVFGNDTHYMTHQLHVIVVIYQQICNDGKSRPFHFKAASFISSLSTKYNEENGLHSLIGS